MKSFLWVFLVMALLVAGHFVYAGLPLSYAGWQPATCVVNGNCFCEASRSGAVVQPSNTLSNLFYVLAGLLALADHLRLPRAQFPLIRRRAYALTFAIGIVVVGLGSWFYHASLTFIGQWFDLLGMYLIVSFILLYNLARLRPLPGWGFGLAYFALNLGLGIWQAALPELRRETFLVLLLAALGLEALILLRRKPAILVRLFFAGLATFAAGYAFWLLDNGRAWCDPNSWLQGHSLWHLGGATACGLLYLYYRSEQEKARR
ncbi:MAG TPA: ceramidase domain-containing protein [Anaerolineaceae bacterium]|nr:ceramidase domain-containing protein [Anaerolineaceae bacterium]